MTRAIHLALLLVMSLTASSASAQILDSDLAGFPLRQVTVNLQANTTYEFSTGGYVSGTFNPALVALPGNPGTGPDSVLSIRAVLSHIASMGSDGCGANIGPSCFTWTTPVAPSGTIPWILMLRAYRSTTPGQTRLWYRVVGAPTWTEATAGSNISFGGDARDVQFVSGVTRRIYDTVLRPGLNSSHSIWLVETNEWRTRRVNSAGGVANAARIDINPTAIGLVGTYRVVYGGEVAAGPIRLVQNDAFASDADGDGLSTVLEVALKTCDSTTSPDPSPGFSCASFPGCSISALGNPVCLYSMQDTDHDGLLDYDEVYGYDDPQLWLPLWGANPAHMDAFIEVDALDHIDEFAGVVDPTCSSWSNPTAISGSPTSTVSFPVAFADAMNDMPAANNPDGLPGLSSHLDLGLTNSVPTDASWGNFGGGRSCVVQEGRPECPTWQQYLNATPSTCAVNGTTPAITAVRRNYFFWSLDAATLLGGNGAGMGYYADDVANHVHEFGHDMWLQHSGPTGSAAERSSDAANMRPNYPSRMNYRYTMVGAYDGSLPAWTNFSYSFGTLAAVGGGSLSMRSGDLPELCPFGVGVNPTFLTLPRPGAGSSSAFEQMWPGNVVASTAPGCAGGFDVDWNEDWFGTPDWFLLGPAFPGNATGGPPSTPSYDRVYGEFRRVNRASEIGVTRAVRSAPDLAVASDVLLMTSLEPNGGGGWFVTLRGDGSGDCNEIPIGLRDPAYQASHPEFVSAGSYPGCYRPGTASQPFGASSTDGVAVAGAPVGTGGGVTTPGAHFILNQSGVVSWRSLSIVRAAATAQEFTYAGISTMSFPSWPAASTAWGRREPDITRMLTTGEMLLAYVSTTNEVRVASLAAASLTWSANAPAVNAAGGATITSNHAPSLVHIFGQTFLATTAIPGNQVQVWQLAGSTSTPAQNRPWTLFTTLTDTSTMRPTLAAMRSRDDATGAQWRLAVTFADAASTTWWWVTPPIAFGGTFTFSSAAGAVSQMWAAPTGTGDPGPTAPAMTWDDRSYIVPDRDLRVLIDRGSPSVSRLRFSPFGRGPAPGRYTDYNDWMTVRWGLCRSLAGMNSVSPVDRICGPQPVYAEPLAGGGMGSTIAPAWNDEVVYPYLYEPRPAVP